MIQRQAQAFRPYVIRRLCCVKPKRKCVPEDVRGHWFSHHSCSFFFIISAMFFSRVWQTSFHGIPTFSPISLIYSFVV